MTVHVPLELLGALDPEPFSWQVPGLREELVTALIRSLPKAIRRSYVPAPNFATAALAALADQVGSGDLRTALAQALAGMGGSRIEPEDWDLARLPGHLQMTFAVHATDAPDSPVLGSGTDLAALARQLAPRTTQALGAAAAQAGPDVRRRGLRTWTAGEPADLPDVIEVARAGSVVRGYPALVDEGDSVAVQVLGSAAAAEASHAHGLRRLLALDLPSPATAALRALTNQQRLALGAPPHAGGPADLLADCLDATLDDLVGADAARVRDPASYAALLARVRPELPAAYAALLVRVAEVLTTAQQVRARLRELTSLALLPALADVQAQVTDLLPDGFVTRAGAARVPDLQRYLRAILVRLDRLPDRVRADDIAMGQVHWLEDRGRRGPGPRCPRLAGPRRTRWLSGGCCRSCGSACSPRRSAPRVRSLTSGSGAPWPRWPKVPSPNG